MLCWNSIFCGWMAYACFWLWKRWHISIIIWSPLLSMKSRSRVKAYVNLCTKLINKKLAKRFLRDCSRSQRNMQFFFVYFSRGTSTTSHHHHQHHRRPPNTAEHANSIKIRNLPSRSSDTSLKVTLPINFRFLRHNYSRLCTMCSTESKFSSSTPSHFVSFSMLKHTTCSKLCAFLGSEEPLVRGRVCITLTWTLWFDTFMCACRKMVSSHFTSMKYYLRHFGIIFFTLNVLQDGLFHSYKRYGKISRIYLCGQGVERLVQQTFEIKYLPVENLRQND